jgi:uncharacterized protein with PIN domain
MKSRYKLIDKTRQQARYKQILEYRRKHQQEVNASRALNEYMKYHNIKKPSTCSVCNKEARVHGHHKDYTKRFEVIWLCPSCHKKVHLGIISI